MCYLILTDCGGSPLGGGRWVNGGGSGYGCMGGVSYACTHACTCMLNMINMDASMSAAISNFYTCIHVHACLCVHAYACVCMWGHPYPAPRCPKTHPHPPPHPRATGSPKHQISITLELIKIIQFYLKILYLNSYRL